MEEGAWRGGDEWRRVRGGEGMSGGGCVEGRGRVEGGTWRGGDEWRRGRGGGGDEWRRVRGGEGMSGGEGIRIWREGEGDCVEGRVCRGRVWRGLWRGG